MNKPDSHLVRQFFSAVHQQIDAEVQLVNSLFAHQQLKGEGNEEVLRRLLVRFLPRRFSITSGVVFDRFGNSSGQCDVIIYDNERFPNVITPIGAALVPVDVVYAIVEVKTSLNSATAKLAVEQLRRLRSLRFVDREFADHWMDGTAYVQGFRRASGPAAFVFSYRCEATQLSTFESWLQPADDIPLPCALASLDRGMRTLQREPDGVVRARTSVFPVIRRSGSTIQHLKVEGTIDDRGGGVVDGRWSPVCDMGGDLIVIDQARTLMNIVFWIVEVLNRKRLNPDLSIYHDYFDDSDRFHFSERENPRDA